VSRRSAAVIVAFVLLCVTALVATFATVPYVRFQPGPTVNVLGVQSNGKPIVEVQGHKTFKTTGQLRMTTVRTTNPGTKLSVWTALMAWANPHQALYPYDAIYPDKTTNAQEEEESQIEMVSSQDNAIAAALTELRIPFKTKPTILRTVPGGPADGKLKAHDVFVSVNGTKITKTDQVAEIVGALTPGDKATIDVRRGGKPLSFTLTTKPSADDPKRAVVGILLGLGYEFPFDVSVKIPDSIGGPSAGLIFSLAVYDTLTPGQLTGGTPIAGTGSIDEDGKVGPIGGIQQKIAGAEGDGAKLFLVPPDNCDEAVLVDTDMKLVRADTMHAARQAIEAYVADPDADLPACPKAAGS
jgi:PDZ domain-containing protein